MAEWSTAFVNDLPDSSFLYIEPGGEKDDEGKTVPRSLRHFPYKDADGTVDLPHLRNALARIPQSSLPEDVRAQATAKAQRILEAETKELEDVDVGWKSGPAARFAIDEGSEGDVLVAFAKMNVVDRDGHVTYPGAFPSGKRVPISAYGHTSWPEKGARLPVGVSEIGEEGELALAKGRFLVDTQHGRDTYLTVKALGDLQEWSYGYRILESSKEKRGGRSVLALKSLDVFEISPTLVGAGIGTRTMGIKSDDAGPLAGLPYADDFERVLADVEAIVVRSKSLRDLRAKEGRELSAANRARLQRLREAITVLAETQAEIEELLTRTEPRSAEEKAANLRLFLEYERTRAALAGVAVGIGG